MRYVSLRSSFVFQRLVIATVCFCANTSQPAFGGPTTGTGAVHEPYAYAEVDHPHVNDIEVDPRKNKELDPSKYLALDAHHVAVFDEKTGGLNSAKALGSAQTLEEFLFSDMSQDDFDAELRDNKCKYSRKIQKNMVLVVNSHGVKEWITQCELNYRNARVVAMEYKAKLEAAREQAQDLVTRQQQQSNCNESAYHIQLEEQARLDGEDSERKMKDGSREDLQIKAEKDALGDQEHKERTTASQAVCGELGIETAEMSRALHESLQAAAEEAENKIASLKPLTN